jgi:hypothetical protein
MGDLVKLTEGLKLMAKLPLPAYVRLLRDGKEVAKSEGKAEFDFAVRETGVYRLDSPLKKGSDPLAGLVFLGNLLPARGSDPFFNGLSRRFSNWMVSIDPGFTRIRSI